MRYLVRRLEFFVVTLWAALTLNFILPRLLPGGPEVALLTRFHGRPGQNDPVHLFGEQCADRHGHRNVCLSGAAWADGKHHVVLLDLLHVAALAGVLRRHLLLAERSRAPVLKHSAWRFVRFLGCHAHDIRLGVAGAITPGHDGVLALDHDVAVGIDRERTEGMVTVVARPLGEFDGREQIPIVVRHPVIQTLPCGGALPVPQ